MQYSIPPMQSRRRFLQHAAGALSGLALSGCGWTLAEVRPISVKPGAKDELRVYSWSNYIDDTLLKNFTAQTGIKVVADTYESNEVMLATFQAGKGAAYSVIYPSDYTVAKMIELKLLRELERSRLVGLENMLPRFQNSPYDPGNRYHVPLSWGTTGLIYNSEKLPTPPQDWEFLWQSQPQLSRRMTLLNDTREVIGATLRSLGFSYNATNPQEIRQAYEKLAKLKPAIATFTTDAWRDRMIAGDLLVSMGFSVDAMLVTQQSSKIKYVVPQSGSSIWRDTIVIPKTAPNLDAAYAWINYVLQPAVSAQMTERLLFATPNQAAYDLLSNPLRNNEILFPPTAIVEKCEGIRPVEKAATELYEKYWTQLTSS